MRGHQFQTAKSNPHAPASSPIHSAMVRMNFVGVQKEVRALFDRYDDDGSGVLSYGEFSAALFGLLPNLHGDPKSRAATERFRAKIAERGGLNGIRTLGAILRSMDDTGNRKLDREELKWGCKAYKLTMTDRVRSTQHPAPQLRRSCSNNRHSHATAPAAACLPLVRTWTHS